MIRSAAAGVGNALVLFGASTGRDGIGGASVLASAELGEADEDKRPTVQVGDPFEEKKLLECSLELLERGLLVSLQDLGAAGLTSSAAEMASQGRGRHRHRRRRACRCARPTWSPSRSWSPSRRSGCSASCEPERVDEVLAVCEKWEVARDRDRRRSPTRGALRVFDGDELVGDMPVAALVDDCPLYDLDAGEARPSRCTPRRRATLAATAATPRDDAARAARLAEHRLAPAALRAVRLDRAVAHRAPARAGRRRGARAARRRARSPSSIDGNGRRVAADPYTGHGRGGRSSARRTSRASGAEPLGLTNNLNFGNPEKPHIAWQLTEAGPRPRRRLPRARRADRRRQRLALQRGRRRPDLPDAGRRHGRRAARRRAAPGARASRATATRSASSGPCRPLAAPAPSSPSCAASALPDGLPEIDIATSARRSGGDPRRGPRRRAAPAPTTSPRAASSSRVAECCLAGGLGATLDLGPSGDARARSSSASRPAPASSSPAPRRRSAASPSASLSTSSARSAATPSS